MMVLHSDEVEPCVGGEVPGDGGRADGGGLLAFTDVGASCASAMSDRVAHAGTPRIVALLRASSPATRVLKVIDV
jgi:hypothetical protein